MVRTHVWAVDIVRPEDDHTIEMLSPVIDGQNLADKLARAVGVARVEGVRNDERHGFVGLQPIGNADLIERQWIAAAAMQCPLLAMAARYLLFVVFRFNPTLGQRNSFTLLQQGH